MEPEEIAVEVAQRARNGESVDAIVRYLHDSGFDIMDSIVAIKHANVLGSNDAKMAVLRSDVWTDETRRHVALHDALLDNLEHDTSEHGRSPE